MTEGGPGATAAAGAARHATLATVLAFALPLALYALTATRTVQGGDTAEFVTVATVGGVPHPPGYPLHGMLARLFAAIPLGSAPLRVALLSALCAAAAVALLQRALARLTGSLGAASGAALAFAVAPIQWQLAGVPEVFSLAALCAAATLLCASRLADAGPERVGREGALLGLSAGLGLANHHTWVLCAPLVVWALWACGRRHGGRAVARAAGAAAGGLALGLLAYVWLPLNARADGGWVWGEPGTPGGFVRHVLRAEYGTLSLGLSAAPRRPLAHVGHCLGSLPRAFFYLFFVAGLAGVAVALRRRRGLAVAALASFLLAGVALPAWFNLPEGPLGRAVAARFHLLPTFLFALFVGYGIAAALPRLSRLAGTLVVAAPLLLGGLWTFGVADWRPDHTIERYLVAAVRDLAPDAVVLGQGDLELFGFNYVRRVLHLRPDVRYVDVHLLRRPWYHSRVSREAPDLAIPYDERTTNLVPLTRAVAARRPTYLTVSLARVAATLPLHPEGLLARVDVPAQPPPAPAALEAAAQRAFEALGPLPPARDAWVAYVRDQAAEPWRVLGDAFARGGDAPRAAACRARVRLLAGDGGPGEPPAGPRPRCDPRRRRGGAPRLRVGRRRHLSPGRHPPEPRARARRGLRYRPTLLGVRGRRAPLDRPGPLRPAPRPAQAPRGHHARGVHAGGPPGHGPRRHHLAVALLPPGPRAPLAARRARGGVAVRRVVRAGAARAARLRPHLLHHLRALGLRARRRGPARPAGVAGAASAASADCDAGARRHYLVTGLLLGLAFAFRYQEGLAAAGLALFLVATRRARAVVYLVVGAAVPALAVGLLDWATWGLPFHSLFAYFHTNVGQDVASVFGRMPWHFYLVRLLVLLGPAAALLLFLPLARRPALLLAATVAGLVLVAHSVIGHKELRFVLLAVLVIFTAAACGVAEVLERLGRATPARWPAAALAAALLLAWGAASAQRAGTVTFTDFGLYAGLPEARASPWSFRRDCNRALARVGRRPDLCAVAVFPFGSAAGRHRIGSTGGYTYLHRGVPLLVGTSPPAAVPLVNYVIACPGAAEPARRFNDLEAAERVGGCTIYRTPDPGSCDPAARARLGRQWRWSR